MKALREHLQDIENRMDEWHSQSFSERLQSDHKLTELTIEHNEVQTKLNKLTGEDVPLKLVFEL